MVAWLVACLVGPMVNQIWIAAQPSRLGANVPEALVFDHSTRENDSGYVARKDARGLQFVQQLRALAFGDADESRDLRCCHGARVDDQVPVRLAFVHDAHHVRPQAARSKRARLQRSVLAPVGGVELEGGTFHPAGLQGHL